MGNDVIFRFSSPKQGGLMMLLFFFDGGDSLALHLMTIRSI